MNSTVTEQTAAERVAATIAKHGLSVRAEFVPFSQSRNKAEKSPSLNWRVTLVRKGSTVRGARDEYDILTTDYSAGCGHCPSYQQRATVDSTRAVEFECERGVKAEMWNASFGGIAHGKPILPDTADVLYSLVMDASVLDSRGFEDWASDYGYDTDSRKGEAIYRECLDIALKLRNGLGEAVLAELQEAFQDY